MSETSKKPKMVKIQDIDTEALGIEICYIKVGCQVCHSNSWGVTVRNGEVPEKALLCRECLLKERDRKALEQA